MILKGTIQTPVKAHVNKDEPWYCLKTCVHLRVTPRGFDRALTRCALFSRRLTTHQYEDKTFYHRCKACCDTCKAPGKEGKL